MSAEHFGVEVMLKALKPPPAQIVRGRVFGV
jgi:hypothetical protein